MRSRHWVWGKPFGTDFFRWVPPGSPVGTNHRHHRPGTPQNYKDEARLAPRVEIFPLPTHLV